MASTTITTRNGLRLGLTAFGDPSADRLVLLCHPTPGAALDPEPVVTGRWGVHVVALDRLGYDVSQPLPDDPPWDLMACASDVAAFVRRSERVADRTSNAELDRCGVVGWGTGGFMAAAIAATDPKVDTLALVGVPRPAKYWRFAERAGAAPGQPAAIGIPEDGPDLARHLGLLGRIERMLERSSAQGDAGLRGDWRLFDDRAWTERLGDIRSDTHLRVGDRDPAVADLHARWYAKRIPGAKASRVRDSGPLLIAAAWSHVLAHVAPEHGSVPEQLRDSGPPRIADLDPVRPGDG